MAENSGANATDVINNIYKAHKVYFERYKYQCDVFNFINSVHIKLINLKLIFLIQDGKKNYGYDIESDNGDSCDTKEKGILDTLLLKTWGIRYAFDAATTILKINQIIMAKRAGGPKPRAAPGSDDES